MLASLSLFTSCTLLLIFYTFVNIPAIESTIKKPHIIFIIADDMGWNDVSFHGSNEIFTPNIDALAYNGVILNKHYVQPICSPSRSALLTGRYPLRDGMQGIPLSPGELRGIRLNTTLMPSHLRELGYATHLVGKWHVGYYTNMHTPIHRGFDTFYGYYNGYLTYFNHTIDLFSSDSSYQEGLDFHRDNAESSEPVYDNKYFTQLITDEAEKIIKNNGNEKPLYLQIGHLACHANGRLSDPLEVPNVEEVNKKYSYIRDNDRRMYAGMMEELDQSVGRVVTALSDAQMLQDSIIIFISDNGAPTIGMYGNTGSNFPLRGIKDTLFEGGVRGAACIFSPRIKSPGRVSEERMHIVDWLPTLYTAAGGDVNNLGDQIDGVNQYSTIFGNDRSPRDSMLLNIDEVTGVEGAIMGKYKLVKRARAYQGYYGNSGRLPTLPAYNLEDALSSAAGSSIDKLPEFAKMNLRSGALDLREKSTLQCIEATACLNCSVLCLFDVQNDPCETKDLSKDLPEVITELESFIEGYRKFLIPQGRQIDDPASYPQNFNGVWMPWRKDEIQIS